MTADRDILAAEVLKHDEQIAALKRDITSLECTVRGLAMADRQALLGMVDSRERELGLELRTAELRRESKKQPERSARE